MSSEICPLVNYHKKLMGGKEVPILKNNIEVIKAVRASYFFGLVLIRGSCLIKKKALLVINYENQLKQASSESNCTIFSFENKTIMCSLPSKVWVHHRRISCDFL